MGYLAENAEFLNPAFGFNTSSNPGDGLFNSSNIITAQLAFSPSRTFNLRLLYARSSLKPYNGFIGGQWVSLCPMAISTMALADL